MFCSRIWFTSSRVLISSASSAAWKTGGREGGTVMEDEDITGCTWKTKLVLPSVSRGKPACRWGRSKVESNVGILKVTCMYLTLWKFSYVYVHIEHVSGALWWNIDLEPPCSGLKPRMWMWSTTDTQGKELTALLSTAVATKTVTSVRALIIFSSTYSSHLQGTRGETGWDNEYT